ncbi:MAG: hypothetical protein M3Z10_06020 [Gemmatimonadota bacterium]|nr:hypothetical protein [Gemmatimonadota bacterium]
MRLLIALVLGAATAALGCSGLNDPTGPTASLGPEQSPDYAVYDALLDGLAGHYLMGGATPYYIIADSTIVAAGGMDDIPSPYLEREFGPLLVPIVKAAQPDYRERSQSRVALDARAFHARGRVELVSNAALATLDQTSAPNPHTYWRAFYERFPGSTGSMSFSRPGYDASRTHALLYYSHGCGDLCGDGGYVLLERRDGKWAVLRRVVTWMS